jgi:hypothetical protein
LDERPIGKENERKKNMISIGRFRYSKSNIKYNFYNKRLFFLGLQFHFYFSRSSSNKKNYNSKREDLEEEDQGEDERNVIL